MRNIKTYEEYKYPLGITQLGNINNERLVDLLKRYNIDPMETPFDARSHEQNKPIMYFMRDDHLTDEDLWEELIKLNAEVYLYAIDEYKHEYGSNRFESREKVVDMLELNDEYYQELAIITNPSIISEIEKRKEIYSKIKEKHPDIFESSELGIL